MLVPRLLLLLGEVGEVGEVFKCDVMLRAWWYLLNGATFFADGTLHASVDYDGDGAVRKVLLFSFRRCLSEQDPAY
jgi:hypothetical protein